MIKKIGVLMGGTSLERDVSLNSGKAIMEVCRKLDYDTIPLILNKKLSDILPDLQVVDFVFIALHGGEGENGSIQGFLGELGIQYNGSGVLASALGMDKNMSKILCQSIGIPTPKWQYFKSIEDSLRLKCESYPVVVKPNDGGSTIGFTVVHQESELEAAIRHADANGNGILIEKFIPGRELTVSILGEKVFPIVEILPTHESYDYECKYTKGMSKYICPANVSKSLTESIQQKSIDFYNLLLCQGYGRIDFRLDHEGMPWLLEINTLPGMTSTSLVPKAAGAIGISFENLIQSIINESLKK